MRIHDIFGIFYKLSMNINRDERLREPFEFGRKVVRLRPIFEIKRYQHVVPEVCKKTYAPALHSMRSR